MIEITEKIRNGIATGIKSITLAEAEKIAGETCSGRDTVYRYIRDIKKGKKLFKNEDLIVALASLAAEKNKDASHTNKKIKDLEKQLSAA